MGHGAWPSIAPALSVWVHTGAMGSLCFAGAKEGTASQRGPSGLSKSRWWSWGRQAQGTVPHREASGALASPYLMTAPTLGCPPRAEPPRHLPTSCSRAEVPRPSFCLSGPNPQIQVCKSRLCGPLLNGGLASPGLENPEDPSGHLLGAVQPGCHPSQPPGPPGPPRPRGVAPAPHTLSA